MNKYNAVLGLGQFEPEGEPWLGGSGTSTTTATTDKRSLTDTLSDWLGLAKQGAEVFQTVKNQDGTVTYVMPNNPPPVPNNTMKYVLIGGGALLAIGAVVLLTRGGKKKSLGEVGAVKTKKKRSKRKK